MITKKNNPSFQRYRYRREKYFDADKVAYVIATMFFKNTPLQPINLHMFSKKHEMFFENNTYSGLTK